MLSFIPFLILIVLITCCIAVFGSATLDGASQVSLLVVATLTYLPYCFFNYLSPLMSIFVASVGWKIKRTCS
jgi:Na+/H+ antiporter NhaC